MLLDVVLYWSCSCLFSKYGCCRRSWSCVALVVCRCVVMFEEYLKSKWYLCCCSWVCLWVHASCVDWGGHSDGTSLLGASCPVDL